MDSLQSISAALQREIKPGRKYNKLFPTVSCNAQNVGDGNNNTMEGVSFMADVVKKYAWQTKKLAPLLQKAQLTDTVRSIYNFEFNHIQYLADGELQDLCSPACTWKKRKTGVDCKSFSIFTSALLSNMGITHAIRQVRQPGGFQKLWTHVYVVVPINQNSNDYQKELKNPNGYIVIDATKKQNNEVVFIDKKDKIMQSHQYRALNAPTNTTKSSIKIVDFLHLSPSLQEFHEYLRDRISEKSTTVITSYLQHLVDRGYNFQNILISEDPKRGVINLKPKDGKVQGISVRTSPGLGFVATATAIVAAAPKIFETVSSLFGGLFGGGEKKKKEEETQSAKVDFDFILEQSGLKNKINTQNVNRFSFLCAVREADRNRIASCGHFITSTKNAKQYAIQLNKEFKAQTIIDIREKGYNIQTAGKKPLRTTSPIIFPGISTGSQGHNIEIPNTKDGHCRELTQGLTYDTYIVTGNGGGGINNNGGNDDYGSGQSNDVGGNGSNGNNYGDRGSGNGSGIFDNNSQVSGNGNINQKSSSPNLLTGGLLAAGVLLIAKPSILSGITGKKTAKKRKK